MGAAWALWVFHRFPPKTLYAFGQGGSARRLRACLRPSRGAPAPAPAPPVWPLLTCLPSPAWLGQTVS